LIFARLLLRFLAFLPMNIIIIIVVFIERLRISMTWEVLA
jgi:hypothetical protein